MNTKTFLQIENPCNQDWNKMSTVEKGRFCNSCATQVIDFTLMTDDTVLKYIAENNGNVCGRIHKDQLQRALQTFQPKKKTKWQILVASFVSLVFSISKSFAQQKNVLFNQNELLLTNRNNAQLFSNKELQTTIKGNIINNQQEALLNAQIVNPVSLEKIMVNNKGKFVMQINPSIETILVTATGFDSRVVPTSLLKNSDTTIVLTATDTSIAPVSGFDKGDLNGNIIMGGITSFTELDKKDTVITFVKKIFNNSFFKILPNPANKTGVNIAIQQEGDYTIQIFDNNSKLIHTQQVIVNSKGQIVPIVFPNCVVKGSYYIRVIDKKNNKQYVDKLIVQ